MPSKSKKENATAEKDKDYGAEVKMLTAQKEQKALELASKEAELEQLEEELEKMQDRSYQVKLIDAMLAEQYAEAQKQHPIDREQEPEIRETIKEKSTAVKQALMGYRQSWHSKGEKKDCVDRLKRIFGELEVDMKRFHKNGMSKKYLLEFISLEQKICNEGERIGTIPVSYHQKVYKWTQLAKELPDDQEIADQEREAAQKRKMANELNKKRNAVEDMKKRISTMQRKNTQNKKQLDQLKEDLSKAETEYPIEKQRLIERAEKEQNQLHKEIDEIESEQKALEDEIENTQAQIERGQCEKRKLEEELGQIFFLAMGKKRELREQISAIELSVERLQNDIRQHQVRKSDLVLAEMDREKKLANIELSAAKKLKSYEQKQEKIRAEICTLEKGIPMAQDEIESLQATAKSEQEKIPALEEELKDFHEDYLIKTYGKEMGSVAQAKEIKPKIAAAKLAIKELKQEMKTIDKALSKAMEEEESRLEALRQEQVERAKEEQRLKKEQEERQERIQNELLAKEGEQEIVATKAVSLTHIGTVVREFENDPHHPLLQAEICPLSDDGRRIITNSIVRKRYMQREETLGCNKYLLLFVDQNGNVISEQRLIDQKAIGSMTETSFELKADDGFHSGNYYLLVLNFDTGDILSAERYQINISFANDFDF